MASLPACLPLCWMDKKKELFSLIAFKKEKKNTNKCGMFCGQISGSVKHWIVMMIMVSWLLQRKSACTLVCFSNFYESESESETRLHIYFSCMPTITKFKPLSLFLLEKCLLNCRKKLIAKSVCKNKLKLCPTNLFPFGCLSNIAYQ
jgi:hypothetical protein